jgi:hypothetical protein
MSTSNPPPSSSDRAIARPLSFASPAQALLSPSGGSTLGLWNATRGSRRRSSAFIEPSILPSVTRSSSNCISMPLMRGDPSRRIVAIVLCLRASNSARTRAANSGASFRTSLHVAM